MKRVFFTVLALLILLVGCEVKTNQDLPANANLTELSSILIPAYEKLMETDDGLNDQMKFVSFNFTKMNTLTNGDKQAIMNYFKNKYQVEIKAATFEQLKEQGYFDENKMSLSGVLLTISELNKKSKTHYVMNGEKYRSGLGAIDLKIDVQQDQGKWKVTKAPMLWIS